MCGSFIFAFEALTIDLAHKKIPLAFSYQV